MGGLTDNNPHSLMSAPVIAFYGIAAARLFHCAVHIIFSHVTRSSLPVLPAGITAPPWSGRTGPVSPGPAVSPATIAGQTN